MGRAKFRLDLLAVAAVHRIHQWNEEGQVLVERGWRWRLQAVDVKWPENGYEGDGAEDEHDEYYYDQSNAVFEMKSAFN